MAATEESTMQSLSAKGAPFLDWIEAWLNGRTPLDLQDYIQSNNIEPERIAVVSVDMINGFVYRGPLSSPRVAGIVEPTTSLFRRAHELGITNFVLAQEHHSHDAPEFDQYARTASGTLTKLGPSRICATCLLQAASR